MNSNEKRGSLLLHLEDREDIYDQLNNEELGLLVRAMLNYAEDKEPLPSDTPRAIRLAFKSVSRQIDTDRKERMFGITLCIDCHRALHKKEAIR
jgi:hypothetical protein